MPCLKIGKDVFLPASKAQHAQEDSITNRMVLATTRTIIQPRWKRHILNILSRNNDLDAVLFINVPINQLRGIPTAIHERFDIPVIYYDADMPVSLPRLAGFSTGFRIYYDADLSEYDLFIGNSIGSMQELEKMGAKKTQPLIWGTDPTTFSPMEISNQDIDIFFYGFGDEYRQDWMKWMISEPSQQMPESKFVVRGNGFQVDLGNTRLLSNISFNRLREYCCRSKINLNIVRGAHASVYGSSSARPFELAAMECCIVSNPYPGLEDWFEPGKELYIVEEAEEVIDLYRYLLTHDTERQTIGRRARERVLKEHTYQHRARQLVQMIRELVN